MSGSIRSLVRWSMVLAVSAAGLAWVSATPAGAVTGAVSITFDNVTAPCNFADTTPLTKAYASQGVVFKGPKKHDGGAILNECSNYGVSGYSSPNFLAFNLLGQYPGGGIPRGPERITFTGGLMSHVQVNVGSADGGRLMLRAYDSGGHMIGSMRVLLTAQVKAAVVDVAGIKYVTLASKTSDWMVDDLSAN